MFLQGRQPASRDAARLCTVRDQVQRAGCGCNLGIDSFGNEGKVREHDDTIPPRPMWRLIDMIR